MILSPRHIAYLSLMFLTIFVGAFTINALCDLEIIDYASNLSHQHDEGTGEDNHHATKATSHYYDASDQYHHGSEDDGDTCCDDVASNLESSLFYTQLASPLPTVKYFLVRSIDFTTKSILKKNQANFIYHEYDDPPPLDGFSLRVVIQSFLN